MKSLLISFVKLFIFVMAFLLLIRLCSQGGETDNRMWCTKHDKMYEASENGCSSCRSGF